MPYLGRWTIQEANARTPQERARERAEQIEQLRAEAERRKNAEAYLCPECCYWSPDALIRANDNLYCPACGMAVIVKRLYAACPRCGQEQNISYLTYTWSQPQWLPTHAAKALCIDCQIAGKRLPAKFKAKDATISIREEKKQ